MIGQIKGNWSRKLGERRRRKLKREDAEEGGDEEKLSRITWPRETASS